MTPFARAARFISLKSMPEIGMSTRLIRAALLVLALATSHSVGAQPPAAPARFEGTLVLMTGAAEIEAANDEVLAMFHLEVQDADLARAQSQVNQRVSEGVAALKRADPRAQVETGGYGSYPVYASGGARKIVGWRVRQSVNLRTTELASLPKTVAAGQQQLALGGINFRLSRTAREKLEAELIRRALANLNARVSAAAQAMNVPAARVRIEEVNFGVRGGEGPPIVPMARMAPMAAEAVAEPSFDAGQSTQQLSVTAKVRFLVP
jgi:predicted secreted protein